MAVAINHRNWKAINQSSEKGKVDEKTKEYGACQEVFCHNVIQPDTAAGTSFQYHEQCYCQRIYGEAI